MTPLYTNQQLQDYINSIDRQKEVLAISTIFNPIEKIELLAIYDQLIKIATLRLSFLLDIIDATNL